MDAGLAAVESAFRIQVHRAALAGRVAAGADPDALATTLLVAFQGMLVLARSGWSGLDAAAGELLDACFPLPAPSVPAIERNPIHE